MWGVSHADLSAARWQELSDESAVSATRVIARENQLDLLDVRGHDYAGRHQRIALFERNGMRFSLVPAVRAALGYDGTRFVPPRRCAITCAGFALGELPPIWGCEWQMKHWSALNTGPMPAELTRPRGEKGLFGSGSVGSWFCGCCAQVSQVPSSSETRSKLSTNSAVSF